MNDVVILGGTGFLGKALERRLKHDDVADAWKTVGRSVFDLSGAAANAELADMISPTTTIVFLAAITPDRSRDIGAFVTNVAMARQVAMAMAKRPPAHVLYISSDAVYAGGSMLITEKSPPEVENLYGMMHRVREIILRKSSPVPVGILRLAAVYGPGDTHKAYGPNRFIDTALLEGKIDLIGDGEEERDHVYVDDVIELMVQAIRRRWAGTVNVATGVARSFAGVAKEVVDLCGRPGVKVITTPRERPVEHRHFGVMHRMDEFPEVRFRSLRDGLKEAIEDAKW